MTAELQHNMEVGNWSGDLEEQWGEKCQECCEHSGSRGGLGPLPGSSVVRYGGNGGERGEGERGARVGGSRVSLRSNDGRRMT